MDTTNQTKQVFVDETGRRGRLLSGAARVGCVVVVAYLGLLVAGFLGASWVPSVRLPMVGDIFDVGRGETLQADAAELRDDHDAETSAEAGDHPAGPAVVAAGAQGGASSNRRSDAAERGSGRASGGAPPGTTRGSRGNGTGAQPGPKPTPNHGSSSSNPNAGPKPKKTPAPQASPNRGSNGNSENAGPKPKPSKDPSHPSNGSNKPDSEPSPTPAP